MAEVASRIDNFRLISAEGRAHEIGRLKDAPAIVVVMHAAGSPDTAKVAPQIEALKAEWAPKGVEFMMVNSNPHDSRETILADAQKNNISVPVLQDNLLTRRRPDRRLHRNVRAGQTASLRPDDRRSPPGRRQRRACHAV
ncbi:MAG: redoxin domain-containing protein [Nitrospiraceae bacterium]|nr:redoxin domain-containing protein [Nitrospiraceae bacterium]